jgi:hypothetical protein
VANQRVAALDLDRQRTQEACQRETQQLTLLQAAGPGGHERLVQFERNLACSELRPKVLAALESLPQLDVPAIVPPSAPTEEQLKLVIETQMELQRIGCLSAADSGDLNSSTARALKRYLSQTRHGSQQALLSPELLDELKDRHDRVCPLVCPMGQVAEGETCVTEKPAPTANRRRQERDKRVTERHPAKASASVEERGASTRRPAARVEPAKPVASTGSHGGGGALGVGF